MSLSCSEISETVVRDSIRSLAYLWNRGVNSIRSMAKGEDWNNFFKAAVSLYFLKLILSQSLTVVIGVALVFAFTAFSVYEQYESEIDGLVKVLFNSIKGSNGLVTRNLPASVTSFLHNHGLLPEQKAPATVKDLK